MADGRDGWCVVKVCRITCAILVVPMHMPVVRSSCSRVGGFVGLNPIQPHYIARSSKHVRATRSGKVWRRVGGTAKAAEPWKHSGIT